MRAATLLLLALLLAGAAAGPGWAQEEPQAAPGPPEAPPSMAPSPPGAPQSDPYRERMTAGHRVQAPRQRDVLLPQSVGRIKALLAFAGALVLLWGTLGSPERESPGLRRLRIGLLLALGAGAAWGGWNLGAFHYPEFGHGGDSYRRFLGAKYAGELGSDRLYACAAVADLEAGLREQVERRYPRTLPGEDPGAAVAAIAHPDTCKSHFSPERWASFASDLAWFRDGETVRSWQEIQSGPGFSATPVWTALASSLANRVPASDATIFALRLLDPLLLAGMWGAVAFAFGWRAACVGLLFWGTNAVAGFDATGGSFLREGWLVACGLALCALRLGWPATAGVLLGVAGALEGFPWLVLAAFGVEAIRASLAQRRLVLAPELGRLFTGAFAAAVVLIALSFALGGGASAWSAWLAQREVRLAAPLGGAIGLAIGVARPWLFFVLLVAYLWLLEQATARAAAWEIGVLGLGLVLIAGTVPAPAYAGLFAFGLLSMQRPAIGIALCLLSLAGWLLAGVGPPSPEWPRTVSLASALFIAGATALSLRPRSAP